MEGLEEWINIFAEQGAMVKRFDTKLWDETLEIFVPLQASEAAALHPEPRDGFDRAIADRLRFGASVTGAQLEELRVRHARFKQQNEQRLGEFDVLLMPSAPMTELRAGKDHSATRARLLRYTVPVSLMGRPAVTLPRHRGGPQLIGKVGEDAALLALSAELGKA
jgi:aspartyl-tRNA(Asn)/glutamyl-tRNA(Gln) amidotransferase subunit A